MSERSVFQHFPDREALFEAVARQKYERVMPTLRPIDTSLPLPERIDAFAEQRARLYELIKGCAGPLCSGRPNRTPSPVGSLAALLGER